MARTAPVHALKPRGKTTAAARRGQASEVAKRSFLRMVSHELRTPLNSIIGFSEMIAAEVYGPTGAPQYKEYAEIVRGSGHRMLKLVNQILEIIRLEGEVEDLDLRRESLDEALDDVLDVLADDLKGTEVLVEDQDRLPSVRADHRALRTILSNLLHNAAVFTPDGAEVRVRARREGVLVILEIEDRGEGVDPADVPRLLQPFEQGENALTRKTEGAGLGLPIVERLAGAMGGSFRVRTAPGQGFTAIVALPAA